MTELPLWAAATLAYKEVFSTLPQGSRAPSNDELDLVALVLSGYLSIYGGADRALIADAQLDRGMFWGGGRRFESRAGAAFITGLAVRSIELERALERIRADLWSAGE